MNGTRSGYRAALWVLGALVVGTVYAAVSYGLAWKMGSMSLVNVAGAVLSVGLSAGLTRGLLSSRSRAVVRFRPERRRRVMVVGAGPVAEHLANEAELKGYHVLGFVEDLDMAQRLDWPQHVLAPRSALAELALYLRADQILVADGQARAAELLEQVEREGVPAEMFVVPSPYELTIGRPTSLRLGDVALYKLPSRQPKRSYQVLKRVMDVSAAVLILTLFGPALLLAMALVKLTSPGPALFRQVRVGKDGKLFEILKLRTMVVDAEKDGPQLCAGKRDARLTPVGRFLRISHLDELPQLWNVLRGEMSLVGPRPERPVFVEQFEKELPRYADRHRIAPGITGMAQVYGYYHSTAREKLRFDLMYLYHANLWLDLCIIFRTALSVFH